MGRAHSALVTIRDQSARETGSPRPPAPVTLAGVMGKRRTSPQESDREGPPPLAVIFTREVLHPKEIVRTGAADWTEPGRGQDVVAESQGP